MAIRVPERLLEAVAYGDVMGLPWETRTKDQIAELGGVAAQFILPDAHTDFKDFKDFPVGTWSDDTEHAIIVANSLGVNDGYSLLDIALGLKAALPHARGWGGTTKRAVARIQPGMTDQQLTQNGEPTGNGCGPIMRSAPLAVYAAFKDRSRIIKIALENAGLTHYNAENLAATATHHQLIAWLIGQKGDVTEYSLMAHGIDMARMYEQSVGAEPHLSKLLKRTKGTNDIADATYGPEKGSAFTTWAVQAVAYTVVSRMIGSSLEEVVKATISEGGDCDSTASIAASLWAIMNPEGEMPAEVDRIRQIEEIRFTQARFNELIAA